MLLVKVVLRIVGRTSALTHLRNAFASGFREPITNAYISDSLTEITGFPAFNPKSVLAT
jgi:hypothetical protein